MQYSLLYISRFFDPVDDKTLDDIRTQSSLLNRAAGVTGLLLSTSGYFCQFLQGSRVSVEETMQRISKDPRHKDIAVLLKTDLPETLFPDWSMATSQIPEGYIAKEIEQTYNDRLADLGAVDRVMSIMQKFRPLDGIDRPDIVTESEFDKKLTLTKMAVQDDAVNHLLELGKSIFSDCDIGLTIREPGDNSYGAHNTAEADVVTRLLSHFPNQQFSINSTTCQIDHNGSAQWSPAPPPDSANDSFNCSPYVAATGVAITNSEQDIIGALWALSKVPDTFNNASEKTKLTHLARSVAEQIEHRSKTYLSNLQVQNSQRQQLSIAANLRRLEAVVNVASSAILALDRRGRILMINDAARTIFDFPNEKVPFNWPSPTGFLDPGTLIPIRDNNSPLQYAVASAGTDEKEHPITNKLFAMRRNESSPLYFLRVTASEVNEADSAIWSVLVFDDVTDLESSRERIRRSDRLEALGQLTGGIAHDFNNLLATIQSSIELAKPERDQIQQNKLHDIAIASVERGAVLTNHLITFALAKPAAAEVHLLADVMQSLLDLSQSSITKDINLTITPYDPSIAVRCDEGQLENALLNILINSRDAIRDSGIGGQILVEVNTVDRKSSGDTVEIKLSDDGPGMSDEVIRRATDPFFSTKQNNAGSGLGLSMVYGFIQQSGGELLIENLRGSENQLSGTQITLILERASKKPTATREAVIDSVISLHSANILLVEDEPELAQVLELTLRRHGHNLYVAPTGKDAIQILQSNVELDLLLTDIVLPGSIDGYSLSGTAVNLRPELRVIYLSGYTRDRSEASLLGPVLSKPVSTQQLMTVVQQELEYSMDLPTTE